MLGFLEQLFPPPYVIAIVTPLTIFLIFSFLYVSGTLKLQKNIKTNYTRKIFHFLVFTVAGVIGFFFGFSAVMLYGGITALIIIYIIYLGENHVLFEGIGREQDEPHRRMYIGLPFIATAIGGLINNIVFLELALVGYLVAGWGDAVGEPIGVRFGMHRYKCPSLRGVYCERSIEGSSAILVMSAVATAVALFFIGGFSWWMIVVVAIISGTATAFVEAVSPHGLDNLTTQVVAVSVCYVVLIMV
jgi:phytol kinase